MLNTVQVPKQFEPIFQKAQEYASKYFKEKKEDPSKGTIEIFDERYILVRAASMSIDFFETIENLYKDRGKEEAINVARNFLFDIAHAIGKQDAKNFHKKLKLKDPIEKLSAGPVHFSHSGWAFVNIFPESKPTPDENFYLIYDHPFSFESDAWEKKGKKPDFPVCVMNAGYSSGWCEESFSVPLVASEITCKAKGDESCRFIMAHPSKIKYYIKEYLEEEPKLAKKVTRYEIPGFFKRKQIEDERKKAEEAMREERDRAQKYFDVARVMFLVVGIDRKVRLINQEGCKILGYNEEDILGKNWIENFIPERVRDEVNVVAERLSKGETETFEYFENPVLTKSGEERIIAWHNTILRDKDGRITAALCSGQDITDSKRAEETLRQQASELEQSNTTLQAEIAERKKAEQNLQTAQKKLIDTARQVGMAETATDVLHNVGNVLNSVNVTTASIWKRIRDSKVSYLTKVVGLLEEHADDLSTFMTTEERGRKLPGFLANLSKELIAEQERSLEALEALTKHVEHMAEIIRLQQSYSKTTGMVELASVVELVEDAIRINAEALTRHGVEVKRELAYLPPVLLDHHKVLQILTNLISNAKYALSDSGQDDKILTIRVREPQGGHFHIEVHDNGVGITEENLTRIFEHGFTTKKHGYGFGLHSAAIAAKEMNGSLTAHSDGYCKGTVFTLELPFQNQEAVK